MKIQLNNKEIELTDEEVKEIVDKYSKKDEWKEEDKYWYIDAGGYIFYNTWNNSNSDNIRRKIGNAFKTREQAEKELKRRKIKVRLWNWAKQNAPFEPDWSDKYEKKYYTTYNINREILYRDYHNFIQHQTELPHFKSGEDVKRFIKENEGDLLEWFGIKN